MCCHYILRSIPAFNRDVEKIQRTLEEIAFLLRIPQRKPWGNMASNVQEALASFDDKSVLLAGVPAGQIDEGRVIKRNKGWSSKGFECQGF